MGKKNIFISFGIIIAFVFILVNDEKPIDWKPTYDETKTNPLDTKIFFNELSSWFDDASIKKIHVSFYEYYNNILFDSTVTNYISISDKFRTDPASFDSLLDFVSKGNTVLISAHQFPDYMRDTLNFKVEFRPLKFGTEIQNLQYNNNKDSLTYANKISINITYFKDTLLDNKLGFNQLKDKNKVVNFIEIPFKKGVFYLHTNPEIFSNYQLLESSNTNYISNLVSYLPKKDVFFNRSQKFDPNLSNSPLRYIFSQPSLYWAWVIMLLGITLFLYFNGKRRQRIIPEIPTNKNTTAEFVKTVSNLFYESEDYNNIIHKKINYFLEHIRSYYHLSTNNMDSDFIKILALKSSNSVADIQSLITMIISMKKNNYTTKLPLINLNQKIENFYKNN